MTLPRNKQLKNIAVVAHVDHGKTTLIDGLLRQSGTFDERQQVEERVMDSGELEKERGITITAKNCALYWKDFKINLLDTPGHADFGGEVERSLIMVDSVLLLVDASEGPLPQTRFVLTKALERGLKIAVVINKIDRPDQRIDDVKNEIEDLFLELASLIEVDDFDFNIPILYSSAKEGWATDDIDVKKENMHDILNFMISDFFPHPKTFEGEHPQLLVSNLSYSSFLGPLLVGQIQRGRIRKHQNLVCVGKEKNKNFKVSNIQVYDKLGRTAVPEVQAGEIIILAGLEGGHIGDSIVSPDFLEPLPRIEVEPPAVAIHVSVSTSPSSGQEGDYLTSRKLEEFLQNTVRLNVAMEYVTTDDPKIFKLKGRGELQLAIVLEELRRKNFEFMFGRPEVLFKKEGEKKMEPFERLVLDIPAQDIGAVTEKLSQRKGQMENMLPFGEDRARLEFTIPSRGLIGYRSRFLTDTRGDGLMSSEFLGYRPYAGDMLARKNGSIVADRAGKITPYALFNLLSLGQQFVRPGEKCYEGMVIGEHTKMNDTNVNAIREKHLSSVRTAGKDQNIILPPILPRTLDWALDWIDHDEWVEVTPQNIRIRKKVLSANKRGVIRKDR